MWVNSEHMLEKCLVGTLDTRSRGNKTQTLSVRGGPPPISSSTLAELSLTVPTLITTPQPSAIDEGTLSLQMLRQAKITSSETEEDVKIQVPDWIRPLPTPSSEQLGTSVDPPAIVGYDTAV